MRTSITVRLPDDLVNDLERFQDYEKLTRTAAVELGLRTFFQTKRQEILRRVP